MQILEFIESEELSLHPGTKGVQAVVQIEALILFDLDFQIRIREKSSGIEVYSRHIRQQGMDIAWLPRGNYKLSIELASLALPPGAYLIDLLAWSNANAKAILLDESSIGCVLDAPVDRATGLSIREPHWQLQSDNPTFDISELSWNKQHDDWFFRHFDHAARVIINLMLDNSPKLKGKILDVGCGDGIIDLGIFQRCQPELLVGIDPFKGFESLSDIIRNNHLPTALLDDERLQFKAEDGNQIPYADNYFDVVLSWGSLEHIAGGYRKTMEEIRRVLKPDGLFFVHPGLYYGQAGNHLGEFFDDPYIHLKIPDKELRQRVLNTAPELMDRAGDVANAEQYWKWYTELNPIAADDFEKQIREMGFEPWRLAMRSADLVEYTPELQKHSFTQLATSELYLSAINKKAG